jgi:hypothetical protein
MSARAGRCRTSLAAAAAGGLAGPVLVWLTIAVAIPASARGCLSVINVEAWDFLNIRARPSHTSDIVAAIAPGTPSVLWSTGPCIPRSEVPTRRWCPVDYHPLPTVVRSGYVKAYFTRSVECPAFRPTGPAPPVAAGDPTPAAPRPKSALRIGLDTATRPSVPAAVPSIPALPAPPPVEVAPQPAARGAELRSPLVLLPADQTETAPEPDPQPSSERVRIDLTSPPVGTEAAPGVCLKPFPLPAPGAGPGQIDTPGQTTP